jgi:dienelactone hydrolase
LAAACFAFAAASAQQLPGTAQQLPGTGSLVWQDDLSVRMMDGAHRFVERKIDRSIETRQRHWRRDLSSRAAYEQSVAANRARLEKIVGAADPRLAPSLERFGDDAHPALVAESGALRVWQVRWPVLEGVTGEGLLLESRHEPAAYVIALPDAGQTPEQIAGFGEGPAFARSLAEAGCTVLVPVAISRETFASGRPDIRMTDQPHREWIYRQAFHMGRHVIGFEVQKVRAAVDWLRRKDAARKIAVVGYGEGGLVAFYAAALDPRIDAALVSGYFDSRQKVWSEPIYRNVWGLLEEFGDAEIASLIAPRPLVVEFSRAPEWKSSKGDIAPLSFDSVRAEFGRIDRLTRAGFQPKRLIHGPNGAPVGPGSSDALRALLDSLGLVAAPVPSVAPGPPRAFDFAARQRRQVKELENYVQRLIAESERVRSQFYMLAADKRLADGAWSTRLRHPTLDPAPFIEKSRAFREQFRREAMGQFDDPLLAPNPRTRQVYDTPKWRGYETVLDVWDDVFAWGVLLVPKDLKPGEKRPVVVCQHGRNGLPKETIEPGKEAYNRFAARLADEGFIVFAPHNLYRGEDRYRYLSRKANNVKGSLFTFIIAQHDQILRWLETLPFVDGSRMAFYGLSYGGETAVRVPAALEKYALSICSGDFNQWTRKVAATDENFSFMYSIEWEMPYFNLGSTFDYAEMSYLIFPRPFLVERGHHDLVGRDRWVAYEYGKTQWLYAQYALGDRTEIEYFQGGHAINGEASFRFLRKHLGWPR